MDIYTILDTFDKKSVIIECGGHLGQDTVKLCRLFEEGTVHCFEANPTLYANLQTNLGHFSHLKLYHLALSNTNGVLDFYVDCNKDGDAGASSLLEASTSYLNTYIKEEKKIQVQSITMKAFIEANQIEKVDLLWLDVEGFEYYILENSLESLKNVKYIYTEVNFQEFRKNSKLYHDIHLLLTSNQFKEINRWEQGSEWGTWQCNVLFKNTRYP
jgi:FkbM family methyltransferase